MPTDETLALAKQQLDTATSAAAYARLEIQKLRAAGFKERADAEEKKLKQAEDMIARIRNTYKL